MKKTVQAPQFNSVWSDDPRAALLDNEFEVIPGQEANPDAVWRKFEQLLFRGGYRRDEAGPRGSWRSRQDS